MTRTQIRAQFRQEVRERGYGRGFSYDVVFNPAEDGGHDLDFQTWADAQDIAVEGDIIDVYVYSRPRVGADPELEDNVVFRVGTPGSGLSWPPDGLPLREGVRDPGSPTSDQQRRLQELRRGRRKG